MGAMTRYEAEAALGLDKPYTKADFENAVRQATRTYHPDRATRSGIPEDVATAKFIAAQHAKKVIAPLFKGEPDDYVIKPAPQPSQSSRPTGGSSSSTGKSSSSGGGNRSTDGKGKSTRKSSRTTGKSSPGSDGRSTGGKGKSTRKSSRSTGTADATTNATGASSTTTDPFDPFPSGAADAYDPWPGQDDVAAQANQTGTARPATRPEKASVVFHAIAQGDDFIRFVFLVISGLLVVLPVIAFFTSSKVPDAAVTVAIIAAGVFAAEFLTRIPSRLTAKVFEHYAEAIDDGNKLAWFSIYSFWFIGKLLGWIAKLLHKLFLFTVSTVTGGEQDADIFGRGDDSH